MESKMENPTHTFREMSFALQLIYKSRIKSKTVMSWSSGKKKERVFCSNYFFGNLSNICVLCQCLEY